MKRPQKLYDGKFCQRNGGYTIFHALVRTAQFTLHDQRLVSQRSIDTSWSSSNGHLPYVGGVGDNHVNERYCLAVYPLHIRTKLVWEEEKTHFTTLFIRLRIFSAQTNRNSPSLFPAMSSHTRGSQPNILIMRSTIITTHSTLELVHPSELVELLTFCHALHSSVGLQ